MVTYADPRDAVSLLVGGRTHSEWMTYRIESDLLTPADAWHVALGLPETAFPAAIASGARVQVLVGSDAVLHGRIDDVSRSVGRPRPGLSISGRDDAAVLVDCSAPIFVAKDVSLDDVIARVVRPLGIERVRIQADTARRREKINVEPGATAWDVLQEAAEANGLWPWFEPDGTLVVGGPDYAAAPVADLIERHDGKGNNVMSLDHSSSVSGRYSEVTVLGQAHGTASADGKHNIRASAADSSLSLYRPLILTDGDVQDQDAARARARKALTDGRLSGETLTATVRGHRTSDGLLWTPGQRIRVKSESLGIDAVWFVMSREFSGGRGARTETKLTMKEDGVWVLDARKPTRKSRKRKKLEAVIVDVTGN